MGNARRMLEPSLEAQIVRLFGQSAESAVRLAYHITGDREAALDLSQEAFVRALEAMDTVECPDLLPVWFRRVLVNCCRDWLRRRAAERQALRGRAALGAAAAWPSDGLEQSELARRVRETLPDLPLEFREALALVCIEGCAPKEAAGILGIPDGTLRWRLHEGRRILRERLG